jgi:hypothetical protein
MEVKDVIALVLGSNFIIAVATFFTTFFTTRMQIKNSDKRFEKELEKTREDFKHKRKWEVRSKPLLKLRDELANMAAKLDILIFKVQKEKSTPGVDENEKINNLRTTLDEWMEYGVNGDFLQTFYLQHDTELLNLVEEIRGDYSYLFVLALEFDKLKVDEFREFRKVFKKIKTKIPDVQEMINNRLEEL